METKKFKLWIWSTPVSPEVKLIKMVCDLMEITMLTTTQS